MGKEYKTRIARLMRLLTTIHGKRNQNVADLARLCKVSERTVYRDIAVLNDAGWPCIYDGESEGYRIGRGFFMPPIDLTIEEALALIALIEEVSKPTAIPFMQTAARAVEKIRSQLPAKVLDALEPLDDHIHIGLARGMADDSTRDAYERVRSAIATRRALRCQYESNHVHDPALGSFVFKPYALWYCQRAWYVTGHRSDRDGIRQLKLNRFTALTPTDKPYPIPDDFKLSDQVKQAWRMIPGPRYNVVIRFKQPFAETASEVQWHSTQQEQWSDDRQHVTLRFEVDGLSEIVWWVLGYGPGAEVLEPPELREKVRQLLAESVSNYGSKRVRQQSCKAD